MKINPAVAERILKNFSNETKNTENNKSLTSGREMMVDPVDKEGRNMAPESKGIKGVKWSQKLKI